MYLLFLIVLFTNIFAKNSNDKLLVVNKDEGTVWIINPGTSETVFKVDVGDGPHEVIVSPDGKKAVVGNYYFNGKPKNTLKIINIENGEVEKSIDISPYYMPHGMGFLKNCKEIFVTLEAHKKIIKVNIETGKITDEIETEAGSHMLQINDNEDTIFGTAINEGLLNIVDIKSPSKKIFVKTGKGTEALAIRPNSDEVWVGNNEDNQIKIIDTKEKEITNTFTAGILPIRVNFTNDGKFAIVSNYINGNIAVYNADTRELLKIIVFGYYTVDEKVYLNASEAEQQKIIEKVNTEGARPLATITDPDNKYLYVSLRGQNKIAVIEISSWKVVKTIPTGKGTDGLAFSRF